MHRIKIALFLAFAANSQFASAQNSCEAVYSNAVRNVDIEVRNSVEKNDIFSKHCESSGELRSSSASMDLTIPIKAVKIGFSGSQSDARESMKSFCKDYASSYTKTDDFLKVSSLVVADALRSYNQCKALEINRVSISHIATESRSLAVTVNFNPALTKLQLTSVNYDSSAADCRSDLAGGWGKKTKIVDAQSSYEAKGPFTIACDRKGVATTQGGVKFPRLELLVTTSAGPYAISMPVEEMYGYDLANKNKQTIENALVEIEKAKAENKQLALESNKKTTQMQNIQIQFKQVVQGNGSTVACPQHGGNIEAYANNVCTGQNRTPLTVTGSYSGSTCGYTTFVFSCYKYPN